MKLSFRPATLMVVNRSGMESCASLRPESVGRDAVPHHTKTLRVSFGDTDAAAIAYYPNYLRWFDQGTHDLFASLGYSSRLLLQQGITIAVIEAHARYFASLAFEDEVTVTSRIAEVRTRAFRVTHAIHRGDELICEGYEVRMWVRVGGIDGRVHPEPLPPEVRAVLTTHRVTPEPTGIRKRQRAPSEGFDVDSG